MSVDASAGIRMHGVDETKQASQMKPVFNASSVEHGAWVVSDQSGVRQQLLQSFGMHPVTAIFHDLHSKGKYMQLADRLKSSKPSLLWILNLLALHVALSIAKTTGVLSFLSDLFLNRYPLEKQ